MDSYDQIGPDKAGYWGDVKAVRAMLTAGDIVEQARMFATVSIAQSLLEICDHLHNIAFEAGKANSR